MFDTVPRSSSPRWCASARDTLPASRPGSKVSAVSSPGRSSEITPSSQVRYTPVGLRVGHRHQFRLVRQSFRRSHAHSISRGRKSALSFTFGGDGPGAADRASRRRARQTVSRVQDKSISSGVRLRRKRSNVASDVECSRVGDDCGPSRTHQILGRVRRRCGRPPRHYRRIRHKQRDNQRIRVVDKALRGRKMMSLASAPVLGVPGLRSLDRFGPSVKSTAGLSQFAPQRPLRFAFAGLISRIIIRYRQIPRGTGLLTRLAEFAFPAHALGPSSVMSSVSTRPVALRRAPRAAVRFCARLAGAVFKHIDDHGILQWRPSRASISSCRDTYRRGRPAAAKRG